MSELACQRCGATLQVPEDPQLTALQCRFCGAQTPLPAELLAARRQLHAANRSAEAQVAIAKAKAHARIQVGERWSKAAAWGIAIPIIVVGGCFAALGGGVLWLTHSIAEKAENLAVEPIRIELPTPQATPSAPPPTDDRPLGERRIAELIDAAKGEHCGNLLRSSQLEEEDRRFSTTLEAGECLRAFAVAETGETPLHLEMSGTALNSEPTTYEATEIALRPCAEQKGDLNLALTRPEGTPYRFVVATCQKPPTASGRLEIRTGNVTIRSGTPGVSDEQARRILEALELAGKAPKPDEK